MKPKSSSSTARLNKFVRRLHEMLTVERENGIVEWRRGLLVLHSIDTFTKNILPKYFNTRNFKTFRRQLNYYGFFHVRSFLAPGSTTTALWVNQKLADHGSDSISSVLNLKRVEPSDASKTPEGRRERKSDAVNSLGIERMIGNRCLCPQTNVAVRSSFHNSRINSLPPIPMVVHCHHEPTSPLSHGSTHIEYFVAPVTQQQEKSTVGNNKSDAVSTIDQAAGLLICLSRANA